MEEYIENLEKLFLDKRKKILGKSFFAVERYSQKEKKILEELVAKNYLCEQIESNKKWYLLGKNGLALLQNNPYRWQALQQRKILQIHEFEKNINPLLQKIFIHYEENVDSKFIFGYLRLTNEHKELLDDMITDRYLQETKTKLFTLTKKALEFLQTDLDRWQISVTKKEHIKLERQQNFLQKIETIQGKKSISVLMKKDSPSEFEWSITKGLVTKVGTDKYILTEKGQKFLFALRPPQEVIDDLRQNFKFLENKVAKTNEIFVTNDEVNKNLAIIKEDLQSNFDGLLSNMQKSFDELDQMETAVKESMIAKKWKQDINSKIFLLKEQFETEKQKLKFKWLEKQKKHFDLLQEKLTKSENMIQESQDFLKQDLQDLKQNINSVYEILNEKNSYNTKSKKNFISIEPDHKIYNGVIWEDEAQSESISNKEKNNKPKDLKENPAPPWERKTSTENKGPYVDYEEYYDDSVNDDLDSGNYLKHCDDIDDNCDSNVNELNTIKVDEVNSHTDQVETGTEEVNETVSESDTDQEIESDTDQEIESDTDQEIESDTDQEIESDTDQEIESDTDQEIESDTDQEIESDTDQEIESDTDQEIESDTDQEIESDTDQEIESDTNQEIEQEIESDTDQEIESDTDQEIESDTEQEIESDTEQEIESDTDQEIESDTDQEIESDTDQEIESDTDQEIESESGTNEETQSDTNQEIESGTNEETQSDTDEVESVQEIKSETDQEIQEIESDTHQEIESDTDKVESVQEIKSETDQEIQEIESDTHQEIESDTHEVESDTSVEIQEIESKSDTDELDQIDEAHSDHDDRLPLQILESIKNYYQLTYFQHRGHLKLGFLMDYLSEEFSVGREYIKSVIKDFAKQEILVLSPLTKTKNIDLENVICDGAKFYYALQIP
ncbi:hypothetical protein UABHE_002542 [Candidatus Uabimicrobium helgolandensis]